MLISSSKEPLKLELKPMKTLNLDLNDAGKKRILQINKMNEFSNDTYENAQIYKAKAKRWHDNKI